MGVILLLWLLRGIELREFVLGKACVLRAF